MGLLARWFGRGAAARRAAAPGSALQALIDAPEPARAPWFDTDTAMLTDAGPVRSNNEDFILAQSQIVPGMQVSRTVLIGLADGMGGHLSGEVASRIAVESALDWHRQSGQAGNTARRVLQALEHANRAVFEHAQTGSQFEGMGTTLVLLALTDAGAYCAWVGDSRLYRWRAGAVELLTRDDTLVREMLEEGVLQEHEVASHPDRSVLSQALGTRESLRRLNLIGPLEMAVDDRFLLCSDGLHDVVPPDGLASTLALADAATIARELHRQAVLNKADDNISTAVVRIKALQSSREGAATTRIVPVPAP